MKEQEKKQYIWEYLLNREDVHFEPALYFDPYAELSEESEYREKNGTLLCRYNAMHRYEKIFRSYFEAVGIPMKPKDQIIFDLVSHYLAAVDLKSGFTFREQRKRMFGSDITEGNYGERVRKIYGGLDKDQKYTVMHYLELQDRIQEKDSTEEAGIAIYVRAAIGLLGTGVVYRDRYSQKRYLFYIGTKRTDLYEKMLFLAETLFLPLDYQIDIFWDQHFGMMGENQTMQMDAIRLI